MCHTAFGSFGTDKVSEAFYVQEKQKRPITGLFSTEMTVVTEDVNNGHEDELEAVKRRRKGVREVDV